VRIDQVNLDLSKKEVWRFCDACPYMERESVLQSGPECPQCGSPLWSDQGQRRPMIRMRQVIATDSAENSRSHDETDERVVEFFQKNMFVLKRPGDLQQAYHLDCEEVPFGFEFYRRVTLREVNFGQRGEAGNLRIGGRDWNDEPFRLCGKCGKVRDRDQGTVEHAITCPLRGQPGQAGDIEGCFLYREFNSEAIRMLLPVSMANTDRNLHSFVAAMALGLRRKFQGDPGHLLTTVYDEPIPDSDQRRHLLVLYDGVPGGTGFLQYLMQDQNNLMDVFQLAFEALRDCPCQTEPGKDGCYRCLLAYRGRHDRENTSRAAALELLGGILRHRHQLKIIERIDDIRMNRFLESELEASFVEALRRAFARVEIPGSSITAHVVNGKAGWWLRSPAGNYTIEPQVKLGAAQGVTEPCIADFVFYPERGSDPPLAVFTDGYEFHADPPAAMRVGLDTAQRLALLRSGRYHFWSLTWADVQGGADARVENPLAPPTRDRLRSLALQCDPNSAAAWTRRLELSSFGLLVEYLTDADKHWAPWSNSLLAARLDAAGFEPAEIERLRSELWREPLPADWPGPAGAPTQAPKQVWVAGAQASPGPRQWLLWCRAPAAALQQGRLDAVQATLRLFDENATADLQQWRRNWREFLRLANQLQFSAGFELLATQGLVEGRYGSMLAATPREPAAGPSMDADRDLAAMLLNIEPSLRPLAESVTASGLPLPEPGYELANPAGEIVAVAELAWPGPRLAVLLPEQADGTPAFTNLGWSVWTAPPGEPLGDEMTRALLAALAAAAASCSATPGVSS
ncbi:MAG: DUF1998 domain-containing protein, partial [Terriglobales bacterium]